MTGKHAAAIAASIELVLNELTQNIAEAMACYELLDDDGPDPSASSRLKSGDG
jgi:hypothetical protein